MKSIMKNSIKWILFSILQESDFEPVDNCLASVLSQEIELTDEFKANYGLWLHREVYNTEIQWELLLDESYQQKNQMVIWWFNKKPKNLQWPKPKQSSSKTIPLGLSKLS